ncbi:MAG: orotidine-5'-phosphate decarboxylase [Sandaracinaceae bacterium]|nr:orotidine-5'-phosphate decarboxylase [Sandaracinaceae bacterium]
MEEWEAAKKRIAFALDGMTPLEARGWIRRLCPWVGVFKVGLELFVQGGKDAVRAVQEEGALCFLDLKLHDIPETVGRAVARAKELGARWVTVHALSGEEALRRAKEGGGSHLQVLAVTLLTSLSSSDAKAMVGDSLGAWMERLVGVGMRAGIDGWVCSGEELSTLRRVVGPRAFVVVPGIRLPGDPLGDQHRVATPKLAIAKGADLIVLGRSVRNAPQPEEVLRRVVEEVALALKGCG